MKKFIQKRIKNEKGLTLVELLAVIVILGIIAAIAVPSIGNIIQDSREKALIADALNTLAAADIFFMENPENAGSITLATTDGLVGIYLDDKGSLLETTAIARVDSGDGNTIVITGSLAGKKAVTSTKAFTKKELNDLTKNKTNRATLFTAGTP